MQSINLINQSNHIFILSEQRTDPVFTNCSNWSSWVDNTVEDTPYWSADRKMRIIDKQKLKIDNQPMSPLAFYRHNFRKGVVESKS